MSMTDKLNAVRAEKAAARENGDGGFTLIELLVVVVIIGVLVAIAIPLYLNYESGASQKSTSSDVRNAVATVQQCYTDNNNTLPAAATFTATGAFAETACAADKVVVSSDATTSLAYTPSGNTYSIVGTSKDGTTYTYSSTSGNITKG